jgi:hypothetical protein
MRMYPTPWQYFLDIISANRIKEVTATGNQAEIEKVLYRYANLREDEVVFSDAKFVEKPLRPSSSYWLISYDCIGRKYRRPDIAFRSIPLKDMLHTRPEVAAAEFHRITKPGFYLDRISGQYHILLHKDTNLWEALRMSGYEYDPERYTFEQYESYRMGYQADGHVDIKYPFIEGRIYVTYIVAKELEGEGQSQPQTQPAPAVNEKVAGDGKQEDAPQEGAEQQAAKQEVVDTKTATTPTTTKKK